MPRSFYALITPLLGNRPGAGGGERPDNSLPGEQPGIDNSLPPFPAHPIVIPPDGIAPGYPSHPIYIPPIPDNSLPPFPAHPIVIPPDAIAPGVPTQPIYWPAYPDNSLPGSQPKPDNTLPGAQPGIDNSLPGSQPGIDNTLPPIELPPLPEVPDDTIAIVLVKVPGQPAEWVVYTGGAELLPPTHPTPKGKRGK